MNKHVFEVCSSRFSPSEFLIPRRCRLYPLPANPASNRSPRPRFPGTDAIRIAAQTHIFETLALKPDQLRIFQEKAGLFHEALDKKQTRVAALRISLLDLMRADNPDRNAIQAAIAEISEAQREMQESVVAHMLEFKSMLDKDQAKKFLGLIQGAMTEKGGVQCP